VAVAPLNWDDQRSLSFTLRGAHQVRELWTVPTLGDVKAHRRYRSGAWRPSAIVHDTPWLNAGCRAPSVLRLENELQPGHGVLGISPRQTSDPSLLVLIPGSSATDTTR
jgi:hypothetical protein